MKNIKIFSFATALLLVAGLATGCRGGKGNPEERMNWMVEKVTDKLELDQDQENKLRDLMKTVHEVRRAQKEKHKADKEEFKVMILSERLDKEKARSLFDKRQSAMGEAFDPVFEKFQVFHSSLKAEQKKDAIKYLEKFEKRFH